VYDLGALRDAGKFSHYIGTPTRLALIHQSFRTTSLRRGIHRQQFAAHFPALGLLNLAHSLKVDAADGRLHLPDIRYFDEESYTDEEELAAAIEDWLSTSTRRIIAASAYTMTIDYLESFLSNFDPTSHLILVGGAHATLAPDIEHAHIVVRGEGGAAIRHILTKLFTPEFGEGAEAAGICYLLDGREIVRKQAFDRSLATLPPPGFAYDLLPAESEEAPIYATSFKRMLGQRPQIYICTQSCQARCTFCSTYLIHGKAVARPVKLIRQDLTYLIGERKHDCIEFHDDDLLQHPEFPDLLALLHELGVPWFCYTRVDTITDEIAQKMAEANCKRVFLGIESMRQANLDYYNKHTTVEDNCRAVEALHNAAIGCNAGFIIGAPFDTVESILQDLDALLQLPLFAVSCSVLEPNPGTVEFYRARKRSGTLLAAYGGENKHRLVPQPQLYGLEAPMGFPTVCEAVNKSELNCLVRLIEGEFYFRRHIWLGLIAGRSPAQVASVRSFYRFLSEALEGLNLDDIHVTIVERVVRLRQLIQMQFQDEVGMVRSSRSMTCILG
jgi:anaerobic magnesium-protoporphyrin IX monomethyl ester cyclase